MHPILQKMTFALATLASAAGLCAPAASQTLRIWPGAAPGTESWTQKEHVIRNTPVGTVILDVTNPTITAFLPARQDSTRSGVIVAPGGYCVALAMGEGGYDVARWLQARGIAAFVLKYRIIEKRQEGVPNVDMDVACRYGIADGIQAIRVVRKHAVQWGLDPNKIGFIGFSAGGMIVSGALLAPDVAARPNFAAMIYGAPFGVMPLVPAKLPPIFMAWAQDDPIALDAVVKFYDALRTAGNKPEAHVFSAGGHGFAIKKQGTTSDHWADEFYFWLQAHGFAGKHDG